MAGTSGGGVGGAVCAGWGLGGWAGARLREGRVVGRQVGTRWRGLVGQGAGAERDMNWPKLGQGGRVTGCGGGRVVAHGGERAGW